MMVVELVEPLAPVTQTEEGLHVLVVSFQGLWGSAVRFFGRLRYNIGILRCVSGFTGW